jgi:hypothetical protein
MIAFDLRKSLSYPAFPKRESEHYYTQHSNYLQKDFVIKH